MAISPLFDIYDPTGLIRQRAAMGLLDEEDDDELGIVGPVSLRRRPQITDLMPEEEKKSLLGTLAAAGSSGLAGLGWILDTPGAMVRGLLSGGPLKGLSALWETTDDRVEGRELLRQYGMVGKDDTWGSFGAGVLAEAALDPLTYASFGLNQVLGQGAKTVAGKAALKAGLLENADLLARQAGKGTRAFLREATPTTLLDDLAKRGSAEAADAARNKIIQEAGEDALTQPITKSNRYWIPGLGEGAFDLYGKQGGDFLAWAGDKLGEGIMTNPVTGGAARRLTAAFDPKVMSQLDYNHQWEARELWAKRSAREVADRTAQARLRMSAEEALRQQGRSMREPDVAAAARAYLENGRSAVPDDMLPLMDLPEVQQYRGWYAAERAGQKARADATGIPLDVYEPKAGGEMVPRQQTEFDVRELPTWPDGVAPPEYRKRIFGRAPGPIKVSDTMGKRRAYLDVFGQTDTINRMSLDPELQAALRSTSPENTQDVIRDWVFKKLKTERGDLYDWVDDHPVPDLPVDHPLVRQQTTLEQQILQATKARDFRAVDDLHKQLADVKSRMPTPQEFYRDNLYRELGGFLRQLDPQHARMGVPIFGNNVFNEIASQVSRRGRAEAMGEGMLDILARNAQKVGAETVEGGVNITAAEGLKRLGYTDDAIRLLEKRVGVPADQISFNQKYIDDWTRPLVKGNAPEELNPLLQMANDYTKSFKTLALANPARLTRDAYSGMFAAAMLKSFNPFDWYAGTQMRRGNYKPLTDGILGGIIPPRLATGHYADLFADDPQRALREFLADAAGQGLGTSTISDEVVDGTSALLREAYPGEARPTWSELGRRVYNPKRTWRRAAGDLLWPFSTRTASGNRNPILEAFDRGAETTDAGNRFGTYLQQIRQNAAPVEANRIANLTQVDYRPEAFTDFERRYMKGPFGFPFYSYTRGILPLIADEVVNRPAGRMGQAIRLINRGGEPSEENFIPEYLRQSASVPVPSDWPQWLGGLEPGSNLKRFLTNIDLPFESAINLITPGTGNTAYQKVGNTLTKTALNLLGQTNPLVKGPLESITNRQFYSGRQLSDLYSMLEQTMGAPGRTAEQILVNAPGGSRLIGTARQLLDDRLDPSEKWSKFAVNALTGLKFQDVDMERTRRLAARDMLNELLSTTPGVRTYENITVPPEVLESMPKNQQDMYLLYKIIQSEAAKRARDKKRQQAAIDPLELLGVVQNQGYPASSV